MADSATSSLKTVRAQLLGYRIESVARLSGIGLERLREIEEQDDPLTFYEAEVLAELYGIDADKLVTRPVELSPSDGITALASLDEFRDLSDTVRARIVAAANAARDLRLLLRPVDPRSAFSKRISDWRRKPSGKVQDAPHRQGARAAHALRSAWRLKSPPITSLRDLLAEKIPELTVLYANLGSEGPAGLAFADGLRGPCIVLNLEGKNRNVFVRRFSLAHELCHLIMDWTASAPLVSISGYLTESALDRERRANAFAVRLLCPEAVIKGVSPRTSVAQIAREICSQYGLSYAAVRLYLRNETKLAHLPPIPPPEFLGDASRSSWIEGEEPLGVADFPLSAAPPERRTAIARLAAAKYSAGEISRDRFSELLGVTPAEDLEAVLDFFSLDLPRDTRAA